ncbi:hypothetical protein [Micavibrio aeruginosavorus]|uniref:hypothetical protein n=1 Tax=Micavibrio aeruginosavorus TaxID=349221 RepID=UPI003F4AF646
MNKIRAFFNSLVNDYKEFKSQQKKFLDVLSAIEDERVYNVAPLLREAQLDENQKNQIVLNAIRKDNVIIFDIVLDTLLDGNVNKMLCVHERIDAAAFVAVYSQSSVSALSYAIQSKSEGIARRLAADKKTDVFARDTNTFAGAYFCNEEKSMPLHEMADKAGMRAVAMMLRQRERFAGYARDENPHLKP